jgi:hypothetical protein
LEELLGGSLCSERGLIAGFGGFSGYILSVLVEISLLQFRYLLK